VLVQQHGGGLVVAAEDLGDALLVQVAV